MRRERDLQKQSDIKLFSSSAKTKKSWKFELNLDGFQQKKRQHANGRFFLLVKEDMNESDKCWKEQKRKLLEMSCMFSSYLSPRERVANEMAAQKDKADRSTHC